MLLITLHDGAFATNLEAPDQLQVYHISPNQVGKQNWKSASYTKGVLGIA